MPGEQSGLQFFLHTNRFYLKLGCSPADVQPGLCVYVLLLHEPAGSLLHMRFHLFLSDQQRLFLYLANHPHVFQSQLAILMLICLFLWYSHCLSVLFHHCSPSASSLLPACILLLLCTPADSPLSLPHGTVPCTAHVLSLYLGSRPDQCFARICTSVFCLQAKVFSQ